ncbi:MAG: hypothetical protein M5U19_22880 [Microthrixaceae bacterium]|nr:hypothetical protein [Microthrixaceae bacterium]
MLGDVVRGDIPGGEVSPAIDAVFTMWPPPDATIRGVKLRTP